MTPQRLALPLSTEAVETLRAGDRVLLSGSLYVARDAAHQRLVAALERGEKLPCDLRGQAIYYMGPSPARPGRAIGSAGPTTSGRMDPFTPRLLEAGLRATIGKGSRSREVKEALVKYRAVYLAALGGAGALLAQAVKKAEIVAYADLGPEAILRLEVADFPAIVINDIYGADLYELGWAEWARPS